MNDNKEIVNVSYKCENILSKINTKPCNEHSY